MPSAVLLVHCRDRPGIVAAVTRFIAENGGNIIDLDQHSDRESGAFFMRLEWDLRGFRIPFEEVKDAFSSVAEAFGMTAEFRRRDLLSRLAIFVTKESHCLIDLLARKQAGELHGEIVMVVSNRDELRPIAERWEVPFHYLPVTPNDVGRQEHQALELLSAAGVDTVVLARYMRILSPGFIARYPNRIINIHHSFLPAFPGARPYHQAFARGVKIIGATAHYATEELDAGPIIAQDVTRVSHRDTVEDMIRKGRDIERIVLARAVAAHVESRIIVYQNKTIVFD